MKLTSEQDLISFGMALGEKFKKELSVTHAPIIVELVGDVGAGKTTLTRGIAKGLGVKSPVTSPSFTISKQYAFDGGVLAHYDFYRLDDPGLMIEDLKEAITSKNTVVVIEWGTSVASILPKNHHIYNICINNDNSRTIERNTNETLS